MTLKSALEYYNGFNYAAHIQINSLGLTASNIQRFAAVIRKKNCTFPTVWPCWDGLIKRILPLRLKKLILVTAFKNIYFLLEFRDYEVSLLLRGFFIDIFVDVYSEYFL